MSQAVIERPQGAPDGAGHRRPSGTVGAPGFRGATLSTVALAAVVVVAVAAQFWAPAQRALEFDRHAIAAGQWWRLIGGNLVHYDWLHLGADAWPFAVLCWLARRQRLPVGPVVLAGCVAIGLGVYFLAEGVDTYRGLSGVDLALLAAVLTRSAWLHNRRTAVVCAGVIALEMGKAIFDTATGGLALPTILPHGVRVVGIAHLAGLAVGIIAGWPVPQCARGRDRMQS